MSLQYIFQSDPHSSSPLGTVLEAAFIHNSAGIQKSRVLGNYVLVYVLEGGGFYRDPRTVKTVGRGDLLLLLPDWSHSYGPTKGQTWSEYYVVFLGPVFDLWRSLGLLSHGKPVSRLEPVEQWEAAFNTLFAAESRGEPPNQTLLVSRLLTLLGEIFDSGAISPLEGGNWIGQAKERLGLFLSDPCNFEKIASEFGLSYDKFRKHFKLHTGQTPAVYRMVCRIEAACTLLEHTDLSHKEIAENLAFSDEYAFSKRFKAVMGVPPSLYRVRHERQD